MGKVIRENGALTVEQHLLIQDVHLSGKGHVAQREMAGALGFKLVGGLTKFLDRLRQSERPQGREVEIG
jgi:hypothetical protein